MNTTIKKTIIIIALFLVTVISFYAADIPGTDTVTFDRIHGRDWNLARVIKGSAIIVIDRTNVQREIYNLRFKGNCLIGRGADNLYRAFYTAGKNNNLSIGKIVCTRKAPMFEMRSFGEYKYFCHLERAYRWDFRGWTLELHTCDESGNEVILEFVPIYK